MRATLLWVLTAGSVMLSATAVPAQTEGAPPASNSASGAVDTNHDKPQIEFNLSSTKRQVPASHHHEFQLADINEGSTTKAVIPSDLLTPAEYVALHQVLTTGTQSIKLGEGGKAIGGRFKVDPALAEAISDLANAGASAEENNPSAVHDATAPEEKQKRTTVAAPSLGEEEFIDVSGTTRVIPGAAVIVGKKKNTRRHR